jgi:RHS repeat-associated protein
MRVWPWRLGDRCGWRAPSTALLLTALLLIPANALAQTTTQVVEFYTTDALGSVRAVTKKVNGEWTVVNRHDFMPFGEEVAPQVPPPYKHLFTGKERDAETGQDYFGARYYRADIGRFTTVDPVYTWQENLQDPQRWNRYAYVRNNPLRYTDPDGRQIAMAPSEYTRRLAELQKAYDQSTGLAKVWAGIKLALAASEIMPTPFAIAAEGEAAAKTAVYVSRGAEDVVEYVGITNNVARRAAEHAASKGIEIGAVKGLEQLSRADARAVEQTLIEIHKLGKDGGTLLNKINSIAKTNEKYADALRRGYDLLKEAGYAVK